MRLGRGDPDAGAGCPDRAKQIKHITDGTGTISCISVIGLHAFKHDPITINAINRFVYQTFLDT